MLNFPKIRLIQQVKIKQKESKMIEMVLGILNAMNGNIERNEEIKQQKEQCSCPGCIFLKHLEEEIDRLERMKKKIDVHLAIHREMHEVVSRALKSSEEAKGKTEKSPEGTQPPEQDKSEPDETQSQPQESETEPDSQTEVPVEGSRLKQLEQGLYNAIGVLSGTKMASHFKAIKQLMADLTALADADELPEVERVADLKARLRNAIDVLGNTHCSSRSKVTQELRRELIELLGNTEQ